MTPQILDTYAKIFGRLEGKSREMFLQALLYNPRAVISAIEKTFSLVLELASKQGKSAPVSEFPGHEGLEILQHLRAVFLGNWQENPPPLQRA